MLRSGATLVLLSMVFLGSDHLAMSQSTPPTRDAQAVTAVQNAIAALGGTAAISQITDTTAQGTFAAGSDTGTFTWQTSGSDFLYSTQTSTNTRILVSGHGNPADIRNGIGVPTGTHVLRSTLPYQVPGLVLLTEINNANYSLAYVGPETLNGSSVIHVQAVDNSDATGSQVTPQDWYFDAGTFLPVRVGFRVPNSGNPASYVSANTDFGSLSAVLGVLVPSSMALTINGGDARTITIASIQFNTGLSPSIFDVPAGGGQ